MVNTCHQGFKHGALYCSCLHNICCLCVALDSYVKCLCVVSIKEWKSNKLIMIPDQVHACTCCFSFSHPQIVEILVTTHVKSMT